MIFFVKPIDVTKMNEFSRIFLFRQKSNLPKHRLDLQPVSSFVWQFCYCLKNYVKSTSLKVFLTEQNPSQNRCICLQSHFPSVLCTSIRKIEKNHTNFKCWLNITIAIPSPSLTHTPTFTFKKHAAGFKDYSWAMSAVTKLIDFSIKVSWYFHM